MVSALFSFTLGGLAPSHLPNAGICKSITLEGQLDQRDTFGYVKRIKHD